MTGILTSCTRWGSVFPCVQSVGRWLGVCMVMKVRITRQPHGVVDGMSLEYYHAGEAYEITAELAEYLVAEGFASIEMRQRQRSSRQRTNDRRRSRSRRP
jgi:hypothetical protein